MKILGDLSVTTAAYGFMSAESANATALFDSAYQQGVRFFDTADLYGKGENERSLGRALREAKVSRDQVVIATKCGCRFTDKGLEINNNGSYILSACDASLERLQFDYIDLYYIHRLADDANLDEIMRALKKLKKQSKILHIGFSELTVDQIRQVVSMAKKYDLKISAIQNELSLWCYDEDLVRVCDELGVGLVAYSPLGRGFFTSEVRADFMKLIDEKDFRCSLPKFKDYFEENLQQRLAFEPLLVSAGGFSGALSELALAWISNLGVHVVAIPGTSSIEHLHVNVNAVSKGLTADEMQRIGQVIQQARFKGGRYPMRAHEFSAIAKLQSCT